MHAKFPLNAQVHWSSRGGSTVKAKEGVVEHIIPAGEHIPQALAKEADAYGLPRDHESYVVRVGKTDKRKGKLYWPQVKDLKAGPLEQA